MKVGGDTLYLGVVGERLLTEVGGVDGVRLESSPERRRLRGLSGLRKPAIRFFLAVGTVAKVS